MKVVYEKNLEVLTPYGKGTIVDRDEISSPVIIYRVLFTDEKTREYTEQQIRPIIAPVNLDRYGKCLSGEIISDAYGTTHHLFVFDFNGDMYYYSYYVDRNNIKHIKFLKKIGELSE